MILKSAWRPMEPDLKECITPREKHNIYPSTNVSKEHCVKASQVYSRQSKTRLGSETLYQEVTDKLIKEHIRKGNIRE